MFFNVHLADLTLNSSDIQINESNPEEGKISTINATIHNIGTTNATDVVVRFYQGNPDSGGVQINGEKLTNVSYNSSSIVSVEWTPLLGETVIYVRVDPPLNTNGSIDELNETNNEAHRSIIVSSWHYVYGNLTNPSLVLDDSSLETILSWNFTDYDGSNLYVSDLDSIVEFSSLKAIGRKKDNSNSTSDFSELDSLLNMTNMSDSITNLYTNGTTPLSTMTFLVINNYTYFVPVANSTNNTNFLTGILWDSSDDIGDNEFSLDDAEDVIFITQINSSGVGTYGSYDFEMRIPATLRSYKGIDEGRVVFYTEIR
jgi:hypothetical protein